MEVSRKLGSQYNPLTVPAPLPGDVAYYRDGMVQYLYLKVTANSRTWVFDTTIGRKHVKRQIAKAELMGVPEARVKAYEWKRMLDQGELPPTLTARKSAAVAKLMTVGQLFQKYFHDHLLPKTRTGDKAGRAFELYWGPIGNQGVAQLAPSKVQEWLNQLARERGEITSNRQRTMLRSCLRWGASQGLSSYAAELFMAVKPFKECTGTNYLKTGNEVERLLAALEQETSFIRDAVLMHLYTGQRTLNVMSMEWSEIDFESKTWKIPPGKTKTNEEYMVALTPKALEILERRDRAQRFVFQSERGSKNGHRTAINKEWRRIRARAGLGHLKLHDLRHTVGTWLAQSGANAFQIQQALNHADIATSQRYIHLVADNVRDKLIEVQAAI